MVTFHWRLMLTVWASLVLIGLVASEPLAIFVAGPIGYFIWKKYLSWRNDYKTAELADQLALRIIINEKQEELLKKHGNKSELPPPNLP